jgi:hypothetical protein
MALLVLITKSLNSTYLMCIVFLFVCQLHNRNQLGKLYFHLVKMHHRYIPLLLDIK